MSFDDPTLRRQYPRTELILKVDYTDPSDLATDYLTSLGRGGLFICTRLPFAIGERVAFRISFPGVLDPTSFTGIVRWRREETEVDAGPSGIGVEFQLLTTADEERLEKVIELVENPGKAAKKRFQMLLIEDNEFAMTLFAHALSKLCEELELGDLFELTRATDGQQALERLEQGPIDLAVIDYFLPVMTGADIIRKMREKPEFDSTRILVVSVGGDGVREDSLAAGADLYLDKPVLRKQLIHTLRLMLTQSKL